MKATVEDQSWVMVNEWWCLELQKKVYIYIYIYIAEFLSTVFKYPVLLGNGSKQPLSPS